LPETIDDITIVLMTSPTSTDFLPEPSLTAVTFEYRLEGSEKFVNKKFLFEPSEHPQNAWLNDVDRDFNSALRALLLDPKLTTCSISIYWDDGVHPNLPVPQQAEARQSIKCAGDIIELIVSMMKSFGKFQGMTPENNMMLEIAKRADRAQSI